MSTLVSPAGFKILLVFEVVRVTVLEETPLTVHSKGKMYHLLTSVGKLFLNDTTPDRLILPRCDSIVFSYLPLIRCGGG